MFLPKNTIILLGLIKNQACTPVFFLLINFVDSKKKVVAIFGWKKKKSIRREKKKILQYKIKNI